MAYIYLDDLKKILPGILDQWVMIDESDWELIFNEIEQKCYIGGTERKNKKGKKWKKAIENSIDDLNQRVSDFICDYGADARTSKEKIETLGNRYTNLTNRVNLISKNVNEAKSMAETAKQRTEVNYDQISKAKNDSDVIQDVYNRMAGHGATREELDGFRDLIHKYDALEKKEIPVVKKICETCKYEKYDKAFMKCVACDIYSNWEAKEEPIKSCTNCKYHVNKNGIYDCTCFDGVCGPDNKNWEAKEE